MAVVMAMVMVVVRVIVVIVVRIVAVVNVGVVALKRFVTNDHERSLTAIFMSRAAHRGGGSDAGNGGDSGERGGIEPSDHNRARTHSDARVLMITRIGH